MRETPTEIAYRDHDGVESVRLVRPVKVWFGVGPGGGPQWFLRVFDLDRAGQDDQIGVLRDFAFSGFIRQSQVKPEV